MPCGTGFSSSPVPWKRASQASTYPSTSEHPLAVPFTQYCIISARTITSQVNDAYIERSPIRDIRPRHTSPHSPMPDTERCAGRKKSRRSRGLAKSFEERVVASTGCILSINRSIITDDLFRSAHISDAVVLRRAPAANACTCCCSPCDSLTDQAGTSLDGECAVFLSICRAAEHDQNQDGCQKKRAFQRSFRCSGTRSLNSTLQLSLAESILVVGSIPCRPSIVETIYKAAHTLDTKVADRTVHEASQVLFDFRAIAADVHHGAVCGFRTTSVRVRGW